jgi:DNA repair protein RecN (Recombination protein N)
MIKQLTINNFAIIDDLTVDFDYGMIALTGETGAGKSIIIDALSLLLGERANGDMVRFGAQKAYIEGVFYINKSLLKEINELVGGLDDTTIVINREVDINGRSTIRLNSRITTISLVKTVMAKFVDIHSQNDNQYLLDKKNHLKLLDKYLTPSLNGEYENYLKAYQEYNEAVRKYKAAKEEELSAEQIEFYRFQNSEIEQVNLKENEIDELEEELKRLNEFEKIHSKLHTTLQYIKEENGVVDLMYQAMKNIDTLSDDSLYAPYCSKITDLYYTMVDLQKDLEKEENNLYFDESRFNEIQERLYVISKIRRKYGNTYNDIKKYQDEIKQKIENYDDITNYLAKLESDAETKKKIAFEKGDLLSKKRQEVAVSLAKDVTNQLKDLHLKNAIFNIDFKRLEHLTSTGIDDVEFLVSLNPGQPAKPLVKVASGGEISRLMLGLKVVFNQLFGILCIIFDEVDTGVSGQVATSVGRKLKELSKNSQVISITHLPQVAALADYHYHVSKKVINNNTTTVLTHLNQNERVRELAKMLSGENISEASLLNAKELLLQK